MTAAPRPDAQYQSDHAFTESARALIERDLYSKIAFQSRFVSLAGSNGSGFLQRVAHIDAVVQVSAGQSLTVEEKIVRTHHTAFCIETHSNLERCAETGKPDGWIHTSTADRLLYAFGIGDGIGLECWVMPLAELREWFIPRETKFSYSDTPNYLSGRLVYHTRCRIVPIRDIGCTKRRYLLKW